MLMAKRLQEEEDLQLVMRESQVQRVQEEARQSQLQQVEEKEFEMAVRQSQITRVGSSMDVRVFRLLILRHNIICFGILNFYLSM